MGVNITGKGVLSGLASFVIGAVNNFNLLVTKIIGYTTVGGGGGSSYYTVMTGSSADRWIAVEGGINSATLYYSDDNLLTFNSNTTSLPPGFWKANINSPILNKYHVWGAGGGAPDFFSSDGLTWEIVDLANEYLAKTSGTNNIQQITLNGQEVAIAQAYDYLTDSNVLKTSTDLRNWQILSTTGLYINTNNSNFKIDQMQINGTLKSIVSGSDSRQNGGFFVATTNDLITFSESALPAGANNPLSTAVIDQEASTFYVVSPNGIYSTQDFITWQTHSLPDTYTYKVNLAIGIVDNTKVFVLYGSGSEPNKTYVSTNINNSWTYVSTANSYGGLKIKNNQAIMSNASLDYQVWVDIDQPFALTYSGYPEATFGTFDIDSMAFHKVNTLTETQISIGDQGTEGAEILAPVDVYTVPTGKTTDIQKVEIFNTTNFTHRYDLAVLDPGVALTDQNALVNDGWLSPSTLVTNTDITQTLTAGQRIVVFPSTVDVVEVKVYGIEH